MRVKEFTEWLDSIGAVYNYSKEYGIEEITVFNKAEHEQRQSNPLLYSKMKVHHIRFSGFHGDGIWIMYDKSAKYVTENEMKDLCIKLTYMY